MRLQYEHVQKDSNSSFYATTYQGDAFTCPYHFHEEYELVLISAGRGRVVAGDHSDRFEAGSLYLFGENLPHAFFSDPAVEDEDIQQVESHYIQFKQDYLGSDFFQLEELRSFRKLLQSSCRGIRFSGFNYARTRALFLQIENAAPLMRISLFLQLQQMLLDCPEPELLATEQYLRADSHYTSERLNRTIDYIHRNYTECVTLESVAAVASLSPSAFSRFFRKCMDQTFIDYLIDLRLSEACRLLLETDRSITEISLDVGFNNLSNFNRQFLKRKKVSPRTFRQQLA